MAGIRISSKKIGSRNGRARHEFRGELADALGIVFSCDALILNFTNGDRTYSVIFDDDSTEAMAKRFAERKVPAKAA